jgi:hypothetical protein
MSDNLILHALSYYIGPDKKDGDSILQYSYWRAYHTYVVSDYDIMSLVLLVIIYNSSAAVLKLLPQTYLYIFTLRVFFWPQVL